MEQFTQPPGQSFNAVNSSGGGKGSKSMFLAKALVIIVVIGFGIYYFYWSQTPGPARDLNLDTDVDGLPDRVEISIGTNLNNSDTDGDTFSDFVEVRNGYNPTIAGAGQKYTEEELNDVHVKIYNLDKDFYERLFSKKIGWDRYLSDDFWFEVYFPKSWTIEHSSNSSGSIFLDLKNTKANEEKVSLTYYENDNVFRADFGVFLDAYYNKVPIVEKKEVVALGANKFQKLIVHDCPIAGASCARLFIVNKGHIYQFEYETETPTIKEIISTFAIVE